jgi:predicted lipoprotein with Yx(FWY)xxD motif
MAVVVAGLALTVGLTACGSSSKSNENAASQSSTTAVTAPPTTVAATTTTQAAALMKTVANTKAGATILTDASGKPLYIRDTDPAGGSSCTGNCLTTWPPLVVPAGSTAPTAAPTGITGPVTTFTRTDTGAAQVLLGGKALYTYSGDTADNNPPNGDGIGGIWHVVKAS